jgi:hypothetical protein
MVFMGESLRTSSPTKKENPASPAEHWDMGNGFCHRSSTAPIPESQRHVDEVIDAEVQLSGVEERHEVLVPV